MTYQFKILAQNKYGDGAEQATSVSIITGDAPDIPNAPTTSIASGSVYVDITWTAPASNNNFAEDKYLVQILKSDGITWYEDGQKKQEFYIKDGKINGTIWNEDNQKQMEVKITLKNGKIIRDVLFEKK